MAHDFLVARLNQGFYGATFAKYLVNVFLNSNIMQLPNVDVIGIQQLQGNIEIFKRSIAGSFFSLGCNNNLIPIPLKTLP